MRSVWDYLPSPSCQLISWCPENRRIRWDTKSPRNDATWWDHLGIFFRTFWNNCNSKKPTLARLGNHRTPTRTYPLTQSFPMPPWCRPRPRHIERPQPTGFWSKGGASQSENLIFQAMTFFWGWFPHAFFTFSTQGPRATKHNKTPSSTSTLRLTVGSSVIMASACFCALAASDFFWIGHALQTCACGARAKNEARWLTLAESWRVSASFLFLHSCR